MSSVKLQTMQKLQPRENFTLYSRLSMIQAWLTKFVSLEIVFLVDYNSLYSSMTDLDVCILST